MPKCPYYPGVRILKASSQEKRHGQSDTCVIDAKTKGNIFAATKRGLIC